MKKITVTAKTVDDAVLLAMKQLNATKDQVTVTILEEPSKGFFGFIGARDAKVEVELCIDPLQEAKKFLEQVLQDMQISAQVEITTKKDYTLFQMMGSDLGLVIGKHGQTLDALQYLVNTVANRHSEGYLRVLLDAENYREKRRKTLQQLADRLAEKAIRSKQSVKLEPMSSQERKVIHLQLQERKDIHTYSVGEEPNRYLVIDPKK